MIIGVGMVLFVVLGGGDVVLWWLFFVGVVLLFHWIPNGDGGSEVWLHLDRLWWKLLIGGISAISCGCVGVKNINGCDVCGLRETV